MDRNTAVRTAESEIVQTKASHTMDNEADSMNLMTAEYNVKRAELDASKADILSVIEGEKNKIQVGVSEGEKKQVEVAIDGLDLRGQHAQRDLRSGAVVRNAERPAPMSPARPMISPLKTGRFL